MWDFKFDAPQYFNFFRKQKINKEIEINLDDPNDQWFMIEHAELTPVKDLMEHAYQQQKPIPKQPKNTKITRNVEKEEQKKAISNVVDPCNQKHIQKKSLPNQKLDKLKRVHINDKFNRSVSISEANNGVKEVPKKKSQHQRLKSQQTFNQKSSKSKSYSQFTFYEKSEKSRIRIPCPYSRKVQKDWESKSSKSWYSLSQKSAKKALNSMKKMVEKKKKSPKKDKPRFFKF